MQLSNQQVLSVIPKEQLILPTEKQLTLPEKVLQFGTGVLLRGLPDYFIDKANKNGLFNGRIVVVKSTDNGGTDSFATQDGLYTLCVRGLENGNRVEEYILQAAISRVLSAKNEWAEILQVARNPQLELVISNTTELGIVRSQDSIEDTPPASFPGKLLGVLWARYQALGGGAETGLVIVPTELIMDNGKKLHQIILALAEENQLESGFIHWLNTYNHFCDSLVDRIVPGKLEPSDAAASTQFLGYQDDLMIMSEVFRLWAIQAQHPRVQEVLSFAQVDPGMVLAPDIEKFRELKLRLLNGTHTLSCALAHLCGFVTVREALADQAFEVFVQRLAKEELAPALQHSGISINEAREYADTVIERFKNPFLDHKWLSISFAYSSKMALRNLPLIRSYFQQPVTQPTAMALGFAAYILFMKSQSAGEGFQATANNETYLLNDDKAGLFSEIWQQPNPDQVVDAVLANPELWNQDLSKLSNFNTQVKQFLKQLLAEGGRSTLNKFVAC